MCKGCCKWVPVGISDKCKSYYVLWAMPQRCQNVKVQSQICHCLCQHIVMYLKRLCQRQSVYSRVAGSEEKSSHFSCMLILIGSALGFPQASSVTHTCPVGRPDWGILQPERSTAPRDRDGFSAALTSTWIVSELVFSLHLFAVIYWSNLAMCRWKRRTMQ